MFLNFRCFYSYGFEEDLSRHKLTHANLFPFECIDCRKTWPTLTGLQKHQTMYGSMVFSTSNYQELFNRLEK